MDNITQPRPISGSLQRLTPLEHNAPGYMENLGEKMGASGKRLGAGILEFAARLGGAISPDADGNILERAAMETVILANQIRDNAEENDDSEAFVDIERMRERIAAGDIGGLLKEGTLGALGEILGTSPEWVPLVAGGTNPLGLAIRTTGIGSRAVNIAQERAENDARDTFDTADLGVGYATAALETLFARGEAQLAKSALLKKLVKDTARKPGKLRTAGRIAAAAAGTGAKAATMEGASEAVEYGATHVGTQKGATADEAVTAALTGAVIGGGPGTVGGAIGGARQELAGRGKKPEVPIADAGAPAEEPVPDTQEDLDDQALAAMWAEVYQTGVQSDMAETRDQIVAAVGPERAESIINGETTVQEALSDLQPQVEAVAKTSYDKKGDLKAGAKAAVFSELRQPLEMAIAGQKDWGIIESADGGFYAAPKKVIKTIPDIEKRLGGPETRKILLGIGGDKPIDGTGVVVQGKDKKGKDEKGNTLSEQVVTTDAAMQERLAEREAEAEAMNDPLGAAVKAWKSDETTPYFRMEGKKGKRSTSYGYYSPPGPRGGKPKWKPQNKKQRAEMVETMLDSMIDALRAKASQGVDLAPIAKLVNPLFDLGRKGQPRGTIAMKPEGDLSLLTSMLADGALKKAAAGRNLTNDRMQPFFEGIEAAMGEVAAAEPTIEVFNEPAPAEPGKPKTVSGASPAPAPAAGAAKAPKKKKGKPSPKKETKTKAEQLAEKFNSKPKATDSKAGQAEAETRAKAATPTTKSKKEEVKEAAARVAEKKAAKKKAAKKKVAKKKPGKEPGQARILKPGTDPKEVGRVRKAALEVMSGLTGEVMPADRLDALVKKIPELKAVVGMDQVSALLTEIMFGRTDPKVVGPGLSDAMAALREAYKAAHKDGPLKIQATKLRTKNRKGAAPKRGYAAIQASVDFLKSQTGPFDRLYNLMPKTLMIAFNEARLTESIDPIAKAVLQAHKDGLLWYNDGMPFDNKLGLEEVTWEDVDKVYDLARAVNEQLAYRGLKPEKTDPIPEPKPKTTEEEVVVEDARQRELQELMEQQQEDQAREQQEQQQTNEPNPFDEGDPNDYEGNQFVHRATAHAGQHTSGNPTIDNGRREANRVLRILVQDRVRRMGENGNYLTMHQVLSVMKDRLATEDPLRSLATWLDGVGNIEYPIYFDSVELMAERLNTNVERARNSAGMYLWLGGESFITINTNEAWGKDRPYHTIQTIMHEISHAFTANALYQAAVDRANGLTDTPAIRFSDTIAELRGEMATHLNKNDSVVGGIEYDRGSAYGLTSNAEFLAEMMVDGVFQDLARQIRTKKRESGRQTSVWRRFVNAVLDFLGQKPTAENYSILDATLAAISNNVSSTVEAHEATWQTFQDIRWDRRVDLNGELTRLVNAPSGTAKFLTNNFGRRPSTGGNRQNTKQTRDAQAHADRVYPQPLANVVRETAESMIPDGKTLPAIGKKLGGAWLLGVQSLDALNTNYRRLFTDSQGNNPLDKLVRYMQSRAGEAKRMERADNETLQRHRKLGQKDPEGMAQFDEIWLEANQAQVNPAYEWDSPQNKYARKGKKRARRNEAKHRYLRARLNHMPPKWKAAFKRLDRFYAAKNRETRVEAFAVAFRGMGIPASAARLHAERAANAITKDQAKAFIIYETDANGNRKMHSGIDDIRKMVSDVNRMVKRSGPLAPIMRDGEYMVRGERATDYTVANKDAIEDKQIEIEADTHGVSFSKPVENPDGTVTFTATERMFTLHEKLGEAEAKSAELKAQGYKTSNPIKKQDFEGMDTSNFNTILRVAQRRLDAKGTKYAKEASKSLQETLASMGAGYSVNKSSIRRKNVAGGNPDSVRGLAKFVMSHSKNIAQLRWGDRVADAQDGLQKAVTDMSYKDDKNALAASQVLNNMDERINGWRAERGKVAEWAGKFGFLYYLISTSYAIVNLTQQVVTGFPHLASKHGIAATSKAFLNAWGVNGKPALQNLLKNKAGLSAFTKDGIDVDTIMQQVIANASDTGQRRMLTALTDKGVIDASFTMELYEAASASSRDITTKVLDFGRVMPFLAEIMNRSTVALAAYELSTGKGMSHAQATREAELAVRKTQFDYTEVNRPPLFVKNDVLRAMSMFKLHPLGIYAMMIENVKNIKDPTTRKEGAKAMAYLLTSHAVFAGLAGSVLMEPVRLAMSALGLAFEEDDEVRRILNNPDVAMRKLIYDMTGSKALSQALAEGLPTLAGIQMSNRVGMQSLILQPDSGAVGFEWLRNTTVDSTIGPIFGMGDNVTKFFGSLANGNSYGRSVEYILPKALRDMSRAYRYDQQGMTDFNGNKLQGPEMFGWDDMLIQAAGFSPTTVADTYMGRRYRNERVARMKSLRRRLTNRWQQSSGAGKVTALREIREFNRRLDRTDREEFGIEMKDLLRGAKLREKKERQTHYGAQYRHGVGNDLEFMPIK